jgi:hypothetical protein
VVGVGVGAVVGIVVGVVVAGTDVGPGTDVDVVVRVVFAGAALCVALDELLQPPAATATPTKRASTPTGDHLRAPATRATP